MSCYLLSVNLLCNLWFLSLNKSFFVYGYVMLCNSVHSSVTTWFLCVYVHSGLYPDAIFPCFVLASGALQEARGLIVEFIVSL